ncbi:hypothetical protein FB451DRAFT_441336 [Mycena latifolia]|nr:hypothetical protein FB451DRAFT_441336 [Mycena latifolia]
MSSHGYSDGDQSPSPVLPDFANETRQTQTPSPRTELLSPTSPRPLHSEIDRVRRGQRGPSERYRRQREQAYANVSSRQLLSLLIEKEYESSKLRKALHQAFDRFQVEANRVAEAERVTHETLNHFRAINESKLEAERALYKTTEELRLWKFQFDHAQREIARAQDVVQLVERQRDDAERAAAEARTAARQLSEQRLVSDALEEGRKLGYEAGFRRAQQEMAYTRGTNPEDAYLDLEREIQDGGNYSAVQQDEDDDLRPDGSPSQPARDIITSPMPAPRSPQVIQMPQRPSSSRQPPPAAESPPPSMPIPSPAVAMPSPVRAVPSRTFETEPVRRPPPSVRSPSPRVSLYPVEIPSASVFNQTRPSDRSQEPQRRPSSQAQYQDPPQSFRDAPPRQEQPQYQPPPVSRPPDNYIPSISAEGDIPLPPPFQLSQPVLPTAPPAPIDAPQSDAPRESWYNRDRPEDPAQTQSWYQPKRPRSNAGSTTGRSNAGSTTGHSARHMRHASLDSRVSASALKNQKLAADYGADLGAIKEDGRSSRGSTYAHEVPSRGWDNANAQGSQRARSMRAPSAESLVPPPPPPKEPRHQKQVIADELRYSDPDLPEAWRRNAAVNADTSSSRSRPPRNVRMPVQLTFPAPLSPPGGAVPLGHMRARTMSGSTGRSGRSQPPNMAELVSRPSLRRVKEKRPISPSDVGSPFSGTINVEPPVRLAEAQFHSR